MEVEGIPPPGMASMIPNKVMIPNKAPKCRFVGLVTFRVEERSPLIYCNIRFIHLFILKFLCVFSPVNTVLGTMMQI